MAVFGCAHNGQSLVGEIKKSRDDLKAKSEPAPQFQSLNEGLSNVVNALDAGIKQADVSGLSIDRQWELGGELNRNEAEAQKLFHYALNSLSFGGRGATPGGKFIRPQIMGSIKPGSADESWHLRVAIAMVYRDLAGLTLNIVEGKSDEERNSNMALVSDLLDSKTTLEKRLLVLSVAGGNR